MDDAVMPADPGAASSDGRGARVRAGLFVPIVHVDRTGTVIVFRGRADASGEAVVCGTLSRVIDSCVGDVVVDLADVEFIDAVIARSFATSHGVLERAQRTLSFRSPTSAANRVLCEAGLGGLIEVSKARPG